MLEDITYAPIKLQLKRHAQRTLQYIDCYVLYNRYELLDDMEFIVVPFSQAYRLFEITPSEDRVVAIMNAKKGFQFSTDSSYHQLAIDILFQHNVVTCAFRDQGNLVYTPIFSK